MRQTCTKIIALGEKEKFHAPDLLEIVQETITLAYMLREFGARHARLPALGAVVHGLRRNPYADVTHDIHQSIKALEDFTPSMSQVIQYSGYDKKSALNRDVLGIPDLLKAARKLQEVVELVDDAMKNKTHLEKVALRYDDASGLNKIAPEYADTTMYKFLDPDTLVETRYSFTDWGMSTYFPNNKAKKTDAELWPVLKTLFPEEYV